MFLASSTHEPAALSVVACALLISGRTVAALPLVLGMLVLARLIMLIGYHVVIHVLVPPMKALGLVWEWRVGKWHPIPAAEEPDVRGASARLRGDVHRRVADPVSPAE